MITNINAKICIEKSRFRGRPSTKEIPGLVARRGFKGGGKPSPLGIGGSEERKKRRKGEKKKGRKKGTKEDMKI